MGDVAIKAITQSRVSDSKRVIPSGSTYKLRHGEYYFGGVRLHAVVPSDGQELSDRALET